MTRERGDRKCTKKLKPLGMQEPYLLLVDANNDPILDANGNVQVIEGIADDKGRQKTVTTLTGSMLEEQLTEADAVAGVLTFAENVFAIEIVNTDAVNAGVFTVNGLGINLPADKVFTKTIIGGTASPTVTVTGATTYIVTRYV